MLIIEESLFCKLYQEINKRLADGKVIIAIEGGSASGKSTLSELLAEKYDCTIFHMDDFFLRPEQRTTERYQQIGGNIDKERFLEEVLIPLKNNSKVCYHKFDCSTMKLGEEIEISPKNLVIIEGVYSMHPEFGRYFDISVFLDITEELQKSRILKRNCPQFAKRFFEEWIPLENQYFSKTTIKERCDFVIEVKS